MIKPKRTSNRDVVIRIATALFLESGYQVTSMDDIVASSKVSKTNIYYHFKSKEELLSAILEQLIGHYVRLIGDVIAQTQLPVRRDLAGSPRYSRKISRTALAAALS